MRAAVLATGMLQVAGLALVMAPASAQAGQTSVVDGIDTDDTGAAGRETVVQGRRQGAPRIDTDDLHDGPEVLLGIPGLALARDGGPLSPSRPLLRGLGGARLGVDVAGVAFADPATGEVDVALLPWGLGAAIIDVAGDDGGALGGRLSLRPAPGDRLQLTVGELQTLQGSARLTVPVVGGRVTSAVSAGTTRGDFPFVIVDAAGAPSAALVRGNNDQRRLAAAVVADVGGPVPSSTSGALSAHVVATGALHEGGVPGFATAPLALRGERARGAVGAQLGWRQGSHRAAVLVDALGDRRRVEGGPRVDEVVAGGGGAGVSLGTRLSLDAANLVDMVDVDVVTRGATVAVPGFALRREGQARLGFATRAVVDEDGAFGLDGGVGLGVVSDDDVGDRGGTDATSDPHVLPVAHLAVRLDRGGARIALALRHATRAPTLDERFAPAGFIRGTPDLAPERITDIELRGGLDLEGSDQPLSVDVGAFASHLDDAIVLVNKNAFEVAPDNTGPAARAGLELGLRARPLTLVVVEQAATLLWSEVEATGAPLPTAPPLALRSRARIGTDDAWVQGTVTGRGSAPSTIFGTLGSGAFVLLDLAAHLPLGERVALTLAVDNALDVRHARDQNLLPLPGRLASVGLEVRP